MSVVYIYGLCDPINSQIKYIGKTSLSLNRRLSGHISQSKKKLNKRYAWIRGLGIKPTIVLLEITNHTESNSREKYWINKIGLHNLVNGNIGGGGQDGRGIKRNNAYKTRFSDYLNNSKYSCRTNINYRCYISSFLDYVAMNLKAPKEFNCQDIIEYLKSIKKTNTKNVHISALKLFYDKIIGQSFKFKNIPYEYP